MNNCKNKIDIKQRDINGYNGLHNAVSKQHLSMVQYLLDHVHGCHFYFLRIRTQFLSVKQSATSHV